MKDPRRIREHELQATIVAAIKAKMRRGVMVMSIPNELPKIQHRLRRFLNMGMKPGAADVLLVIDGRAHFLEIKTEEGMQNLHQKSFELECEFIRIPYMVVRSFNEAMTVCEGWQAFREPRARAA